MKKLLFLLLLGATAQAQITTKCKVCPPSLTGVTSGAVLRDSSGRAIWQVLSGLDTNAVDVNTLNYWSRSGNAGTNPATNFIGTTDSVGLLIKADNKTEEGIGYGIKIAGSSKFGYDAVNVEGYSSGGVGVTIVGHSTETGIGAVIISANNDGNNNHVLINSAVKIVDGTQGAGKVLTSDSNGLASWKTDTTGSGLYLPLAGGTMDSGSHIYFGTGGQNISQGTFDNSTGGNRGISLNCAVGYELNWQGGHLSSSYNNGTTFYPVVIDSGLTVTGSFSTGFTGGGVTSHIFNGDGTSLGADSCFLLLGSVEGSRITVGQQTEKIVFSAVEVKSKTQYFNVNDTANNPAFEVDFDNNVINNKLPVSIQDGTEGAGKVFTSDSTGLGSWQGGIIYDSLTSLTGQTITLTNNSTHIAAASGTITDVTWNFPIGTTGDVLDIENMQVITTLNITGTGTGTITAAKITNSKTAGLKTFHNYGGNWY